ncbi:hypothetical protein K438DRAFT_1986690 [Mycena galopus ATCC 62051]|nr:hypothetical protein K438DRAFT_1986690 [Mycena galopus ATCC 62051]
MQGLRAVRQLTSRPPLPALRQPIVYPALAIPQSTAPTTRRTPIWDQKPYLNFYRTKIDLGLFSCDWENNLAGDFFAADFQNSRPHPIRPLAFLDYYEPCILFEASGEYCYLDTGSNDYLIHYGHAFASPDEFLTAFIHRHTPLEGTVYEFPEDVEDLYGVVSEEQVHRRREAAEKARQN